MIFRPAAIADLRGATLPARAAAVIPASLMGHGAPEVLPRSNVDRLRESLAAKGGKVEVLATEGGGVVGVKYNEPPPGRPERPEAQFSAWLVANAALLGRGDLGATTFGRPRSREDDPVLVFDGDFEPSAGCRHLGFVAAYQKVPGGHAPLLISIACRSVPEEEKTYQSFERAALQLAESLRQVELARDPVAKMLMNEGVRVAEVARFGGETRIFLETPIPVPVDAEPFVKALAERAARAAGLPALDKVDLDPRLEPKKPKAPGATFRELVHRLAKPPLDGRCIDPRVKVGLGSPDFDRVVQVDVTCASEPAEGSRAPGEAGRTLPRAASGKLDHVAFCDSMSWNVGMHTGTVIDKRGDVFVFTDAPMSVPKTTHELAVLARHGRRYVGTLPPADLDKLVALTPRVEGEPLARSKVEGADMAGGGCSLVRGGQGDRLALVRLFAFGNDVAARNGPASKDAVVIVRQAQAMRK